MKVLRCQDCKHFGHDKITLGGKKAAICYKKVKREIIRDGYLLARCYYATSWNATPCDIFELKVVDEPSYHQQGPGSSTHYPLFKFKDK